MSQIGDGHEAGRGVGISSDGAAIRVLRRGRATEECRHLSGLCKSDESMTPRLTRGKQTAAPYPGLKPRENSLILLHFENQAVKNAVGGCVAAGNVAQVVDAVEAGPDRSGIVVRHGVALDQHKGVFHTLCVKVMAAEPARVVEAVHEHLGHIGIEDHADRAARMRKKPL